MSSNDLGRRVLPRVPPLDRVAVLSSKRPGLWRRQLRRTLSVWRWLMRVTEADISMGWRSACYRHRGMATFTVKTSSPYKIASLRPESRLALKNSSTSVQSPRFGSHVKSFFHIGQFDCAGPGALPTAIASAGRSRGDVKCDGAATIVIEPTLPATPVF